MTQKQDLDFVTEEVIDEIRKLCDENQVEFELISKLIIEIDGYQHFYEENKEHFV